MSNTPVKDTNSYFIPKELTTPTKDGERSVSKTIFKHISMLQSLLNDWDKLQNKGKKICRSISSLKMHEFQDNYNPHPVKVLIESLVEVVDSFENVLEGTQVLNKQMRALAQLQNSDIPVMYTWAVKQIAENVANINESLTKEFKLKKTILENIAHCRDEHLVEVYTSAWEYYIYLDKEKISYLFVEVGLTIP